MTEDEAKKALFEVHFEYMLHSPKERIKLYDEYQKKRSEIKHELSFAIMEKKQKQMKLK